MSLKRQQSSLFDVKAQLARKEENDRQAKQHEYSEKHNLNALFEQFEAVLKAGGAPKNEDEAHERLLHFLVQRKEQKEQQRQLFAFRESIELCITGKSNVIKLKAAVWAPSVSGQRPHCGVVGGTDVLLTMACTSVGNRHSLLSDDVAVDWERFEAWERILLQLAPLADGNNDKNKALAVSAEQPYVAISIDGKSCTAVVRSASAAAKLVIDELWNFTMELRQVSRGVELFQPL